MAKKNWAFIFLLFMAFSMWLSVLAFGHDHYVDENIHMRQINRFAGGNFEVLPSLTTLPGYNAAVALFSHFLRHPSSTNLRLISFLLCLPAIWIFFAIAKKINMPDPSAKTLQFIFLPISFFYFPLVYTDIFSLLLVLLSFYFMIGKKYKFSAIFSLASLLVRQTNIVWIAFAWIYEYVSLHGFSFSFKDLRLFARQTFGHIALFAASAVFILLNKGIAIGDRDNHPLGLYLGNIYFFLALTGLFFLPVLISSFRNMDQFKRKRFLVFGCGVGATLACFFLLHLPAIHEGNLKLHFLRNIVLNFAYHQYAWAYALAIFLGYISLFLMKFDRASLLIFPFAAVGLLPSLLVEHRYAIVPMVFLLLLRKGSGNKIEFALALFFFALSLPLLYMLLETSLFF